MMPYIARKPANFDRSYSIGETIPDAVVDPGRAASLIAMGRLSYIEPEEEPEKEPEKDDDQEGAQAPQEGAGESAGVNAPEATENAAGEAVEAAEQPKKGKAKK